VRVVSPLSSLAAFSFVNYVTSAIENTENKHERLKSPPTTKNAITIARRGDR